MVSVIHLYWHVVVELLSPLVPSLSSTVCFVWAALRIFLLLISIAIVLFQCRLSVCHWEVVLFCQVSQALVLPHESSSLVVLAMPSDLLRGFAIQAEEETRGGAKLDTRVLPHLACNVVAAAKFIGKPVAIGIKQDSSDAPQCLCSQELHLRIGILRVDKASWVHLYPLKVNGVSTHGHGHLQSIASAMLAICGGQVSQVRPILVQQRIRREVCTKATCGNHNWSMLCELLPISKCSLNTANRSSLVSDQAVNLGLQHDASTVRLLAQLL
mmetsp:Transcript_31396/g.71694  ORF Transcript_31396/g.71694 Transcript_31396/m.71694 type:complete len:270 (-) Transcript_31396:346-1155(-)